MLHSDDFSQSDPAWGLPEGNGARIAGGKLTLVPEQDNAFVLVKTIGPYTDFDVCVSAVQKADDPVTSWASIVFWVNENGDFYVFNVATNGQFAVSHRINGNWETPRDWESAGDVVNAGEEPNEIRVVGKGNTATLYVNDTEVGTFTGEAPAAGGPLGVYARSPAGSVGTFEFDDFSVAEPS